MRARQQCLEAARCSSHFLAETQNGERQFVGVLSATVRHHGSSRLRTRASLSTLVPVTPTSATSPDIENFQAADMG